MVVESGKAAGALQTAALSRGDVAMGIGLAALWLCLQSSGYYPLSVADYHGSMAPFTVASFHLVYGAALVVVSLVALVGRREAASALRRTSFVAVSGALGIVGHGLLWWAGASELYPPSALAAGAVTAAFFVVTMVLLWGGALSAMSLNRALGTLIASFLLAQLVVVLASLAGIDQCAFVTASSAVCAICAIMFCRLSPADENDPGACANPGERPSLPHTIPWGMVAPALLLLYFCEIFIRLRSGAYLGSVDPQRQIITGVIAFATFAIIALVLIFVRQGASEKSFILVFAIVMLAYLLALVGMLIFDAENRYVTNRILVACSHCDEVFLWMLLVPAVKRSNGSFVTAFALLVIFTLAIPWILSFDVYYLTGLDAFFAGRDVLVYGVALALVVATTGTVGFLLLYTLRMQGAPAEAASADAIDTRAVEDVLAPYGLTPREMEVAEYLSRGHSARKIAEELFLSEASIRAHTQHIYRKMAIHSRQEFLDAVDEARRTA